MPTTDTWENCPRCQYRHRSADIQAGVCSAAIGRRCTSCNLLRPPYTLNADFVCETCVAQRKTRATSPPRPPKTEPRRTYDDGFRDGKTAGRNEGRREGYAEGYSAGLGNGSSKAPPVTADLRWLIRLAHPDRHMDGDVDRAHRVTVWLNALHEAER